MSENVENGLRLTVEAQEGEAGNGRPIYSGTPGTVTMSPEFARGAAEALRAYVVGRLDFWLGVLVISRHGDGERPETALDFSAPNQPTKEQIEHLLRASRWVTNALEVLHEMAPWTFDDDDGGDPEPEPEPDPAEAHRA